MLNVNSLHNDNLIEETCLIYLWFKCVCLRTLTEIVHAICDCWLTRVLRRYEIIMIQTIPYTLYDIYDSIGPTQAT